MVNNVGFNSAYNMNQYSKDIENVAKYALGSTLVAHEESPFEGIGMMLGIGGAIEAFKGGKWLYSNRKDVNGAWSKFSTEATAKADVFKKAGGVTSWDAYKIAINDHKTKAIKEMIPQGDKLTKLSVKTQNLYKEVEKATELIAKDPTKAKEVFKIANEKLVQANALAHGELAKIPATGFWGKLGKGFSKYSGFSKLEGAMKNFALKSPAMGSLLKYGKGNALFIGVEGIMGLFTQVIPSFNQLGPVSGIKQIFKTGVKAVASAGGWVVGSAIAGQGGAMVGAAIGSIVPGVGTVIGGVIGGLIGMVGGCIGSWAAVKVATKLVGKDELELAKEKDAKKLAKQASKSPEEMQAMLTTATQRLQAEGAETEDAKVVFGSLQNLAKIAQTQPSNNETAVQDNTAFTGMNNPYNPEIMQKMYEQQDANDKDFMASSVGLI